MDLGGSWEESLGSALGGMCNVEILNNSLLKDIPEGPVALELESSLGTMSHTCSSNKDVHYLLLQETQEPGLHSAQLWAQH